MGVGLMATDARHPGMVTRLAVLVAALVLGGAAPALAQSAAPEDDPYDPPPDPEPGAITVEKSASPTTVPEPGGDVTFAVVVHHAAPDSGAIALTALVDDVHGDLNGRGTCAIAQVIEPGGSYGCEFTAFVGGQPGFTETDTVFAGGVDINGDPVAAIDTATVTVTDVPSVLRVDKVASVDVVSEAGESVRFSVVVANESSVDDITVKRVRDDVFGDVGGSCDVELPHTLAPGESFACAFDEFISGAVGRPHVNVVKAVGKDDDGVNVRASDDAVVRFEALPTSSLGDTVWLDANANGAMDGDETGFAGVRLRLTMPDGTHRWQTTGTDGRYRFVGLVGGDYRVRVTPPEGWATTTISAMDVTLAGGDAYLGADFGLAQALPLTGMDIETFTWIGLALVFAGVGLLVVAGRRRRIQIPARKR